MRFAAPEWLALSAVPIVLAILGAWWARRERRRWASHADPELLRAMVEADRPERARRRQWVLGLLALVLASVALARPQYGHRTEVRTGRGFELVFALDLSRSMLAEDVKPNRLERARLELEDLLGSLRGHRVGLVGFTSIGIPLTPLTIDRSAVRLQLERADPSVMPRGGTSIAGAIEASRSLLEAAPTPGAGRAIIVVTDGEDHRGRGLDAARRAREAGIAVHVVGIGSETGQPIPVIEDGVRRGWVRDAAGRTVLTRLEPGALRAVAEAGGGVAALPAGGGGIDLSRLRAHLAALAEAELEARTVRVYEERYRWFTWPALLLSFLSTVLRPRRPRAATLGLVLWGFGAAVVGAPGAARAQSVLERPSPDVEAGIEALRSGDAAAAEERFDALIRERGPSPELLYNRGLARAAQERWDEAADDLSRAAESAPSPELRGRAEYALGNAHRRAGRLDLATEAYRRALLTDPSLEGARRNLEVTRALRMRSPPPPSGDGESDERDREDEGGDPKAPNAGGREGSDAAPSEPVERDEDAPPKTPPEAGDEGSEERDRDGDRHAGPKSEAPSDAMQPEPQPSPQAEPPESEDGPSSSAPGEAAEGPPKPSASAPSAEPPTGEAAGEREVPGDVEALLEALRQQERVLQRKMFQKRYGGGRPVEKDW